MRRDADHIPAQTDIGHHHELLRRRHPRADVEVLELEEDRVDVLGMDDLAGACDTKTCTGPINEGIVEHNTRLEFEMFAKTHL